MADVENRNDLIKVVTAIEAIRARPKMFVGSTDQKGLCWLVHLLILNAIDGVAYHREKPDTRFRASRIDVFLHLDGYATVLDNGPGVPVDLTAAEQPNFKDPGIPWLEYLFTTLFAPGMNPLPIVSALSQHLRITVDRNGGVWEQEYRAGKPATGLSRVGASDQHGTSIRFLADSAIFSTVSYDFDTLAEDIRTLASDHPGLAVTLIDEREVDQGTGAFRRAEFGS